MDQVRAALAWLKKHHFWVLTAVVTMVSLGCWYTAAGDLSERYEESKSKIEGEFSSQTRLQNEPFHPNRDVNVGQLKENKKQAQEVQALWQQLYDEQKDVLKWPDALTPRFHREVAKKKFGDNIPSSLRDDYLNYAKEHFPELPKIVHAYEIPASASIGGSIGRGGGRGGGGRGSIGSSFDLERFQEALAEGQLPGGARRSEVGVEEEQQVPEFIVWWEDQTKIREQLNFVTRPSSLQIWVTQEDLWVYTTLLQIIAQTNEAAGATRFSNAAVRVIESLEVGQEAAMESQAQGRIAMRTETPGRGAGGDGGREYYDRSSRMDGGGVEARMGGGTTREDYLARGGGRGEGPSKADEDALLLSQRYLDETGKPKNVSTGWTPQQLGVEYKRLPIRMILHMDQRWLYELISNCANAPLQVEVREVRINPLEGGQGGGSRGRSRRMYDLQTQSSGRPLGLSRSSGRDGALTDVNVFDRQPNLVPVVIQGNIYIFNEPDPTVLESDAGSA